MKSSDFLASYLECIPLIPTLEEDVHVKRFLSEAALLLLKHENGVYDESLWATYEINSIIQILLSDLPKLLPSFLKEIIPFLVDGNYFESRLLSNSLLIDHFKSLSLPCGNLLEYFISPLLQKLWMNSLLNDSTDIILRFIDETLKFPHGYEGLTIDDRRLHKIYITSKSYIDSFSALRSSEPLNSSIARFILRNWEGDLPALTVDDPVLHLLWSDSISEALKIENLSWQYQLDILTLCSKRKPPNFLSSLPLGKEFLNSFTYPALDPKVDTPSKMKIIQTLASHGKENVYLISLFTSIFKRFVRSNDFEPIVFDESLDKNTRYLRSVLEICERFFKTGINVVDKMDVNEMILYLENLVIKGDIEESHRLSCLKIFISLSSVYEMSEDLWESLVLRASRSWQINDRVLELLTQLNQSGQILPKNIDFLLKKSFVHEEPYVRQSAVELLNTLLITDHSNYNINRLGTLISDCSDYIQFFSKLLFSETEAIVRRKVPYCFNSFELLKENPSSSRLRSLLISSLTDDLDSEVKENILSLWEPKLNFYISERSKDEEIIRILLEPFLISSKDFDKRVKQIAFINLQKYSNYINDNEKLLSIFPEFPSNINCEIFDNYVEGTFGFEGLIRDILITKDKNYVKHDMDCF